VSTPRRHHFVQKAYLDRFAEDGQVYVRRRDGKSFRSSTVNVAVETGFYDISDASGKRSMVVEEHLTTIEGPAMAALGRIDEGGEPPGWTRRTEGRWPGILGSRPLEPPSTVSGCSALGAYPCTRAIER
jgi:hypothetical protein